MPTRTQWPDDGRVVPSSHGGNGLLLLAIAFIATVVVCMTIGP
jgi:hypothetical protein